MRWNGKGYDKDGDIILKFKNHGSIKMHTFYYKTGKYVNWKWKRIVIEKKKKGVLYGRISMDEPFFGWIWYIIGDGEEDGKYDGEIENGIPNGQGTFTWHSGHKYVGEFKDGEYNGQGIETRGTKMYEGEYKDGKKHGKGKLTKSDGRKYEGEWKNNKPNGQGTFTSPDGTKYVGEWKNGEPWNGTFYDKDGNIKGKVVNGEEIEQ